MDDSTTLDELFRLAVSCIDDGHVNELERLVTANPRLVRERLDSPGAWLRDKVGDALDGFFQKPYLLWFIAEDPVRDGTLPPNIADVTRAILRAAERERVETLQEQLDYALTLVSWSWIARDRGVQIDLNLDAVFRARPHARIRPPALPSRSSRRRWYAVPSWQLCPVYLRARPPIRDRLRPWLRAGSHREKQHSNARDMAAVPGPERQWH